MARIRTIKPDFFTSLTIADLPKPTRLTFIGLWTHVDDKGRCVADPRLIKAAVWPLDDDVTANDVAADLRILSESSLITHYTVGERSYLVVNGFAEHQRINRPGESKLPGPEMADSIEGVPVKRPDAGGSTSGNESSGSDHGAFTEDSLSLHGGLTPGKERKGTGNREQGKEQGGASAPPRGPKPGTDADPDWIKFWDTYPLKKSKDGARKSWASAIKRADAADIIAGAERYRDDPNRKSEFTKHPTTWLNQGCWADEPTPAHQTGYQPYQDPDPADYYGAI